MKQPSAPSSTPQPAARPDLRPVLLDVARATASQRGMEMLLRDLATLLGRVASFDRLGIVLHDAECDRMRLHTLTAAEPTTTTAIELAVEESPAGAVWRTQQPLVVADLERDERFPAIRRILAADGFRSYCVLPLTSPLRRLGSLSFASRRVDAFSDADVTVLGELAPQVALAVDNTLHHEAAVRAQRALEHERDRLRLLLDVSDAVVSNLDLHRLLVAIAQSVKRLVPHDATTLSLHEPRTDRLRVHAVDFADGKGLIREGHVYPLDVSPGGRAFRLREPVVASTTAELAAYGNDVTADLIAEGVQSVVCAPLVVDGRAVGTLNAGSRRPDAFAPADVELFAQVARQIAPAVANALAFREIEELKEKLAAEKVYLEDEIRTDRNFEEIVGESPLLREVLRQVETVAATPTTVLVRGETGTGKERIARAIHELSPRRQRTLVKVNCAAIPAGLLESELFGHERGAFTGAIAQRVGRFELADGGTLFLDEVGDIPLELQPKLLRVLEEQAFERLGGAHTKQVDVRVVAATNRDLEAMVEAGTFRSDLYYRLNVFPIVLPPLRERRDDVPQLVRYFTQKFARRMNKRIETVSADALAVLAAYDWPGNVRELENAIERAVILTAGSVLRVPVAELRPRAVPVADVGTLAATERDAILRALNATAWVLGGPRGAAARLGLKRTTLQSRMEKLGIRRPSA
jgi:formate hydrogenlyase transcriptional activator